MKSVIATVCLVVSLGAHAESRERPVIFDQVDKVMSHEQRLEHLERHLRGFSHVLCNKGIDGVQPVDVTMIVKDANGDATVRSTRCGIER